MTKPVLRLAANDDRSHNHGEGNPPEPPDMELTERVGHLEIDMRDVRDRMIRVETKIDSHTDLFATKADVANAKNSIIMWLVSAILIAQLLPALLRKFGL
jgi:hypothetical protein